MKTRRNMDGNINGEACAAAKHNGSDDITLKTTKAVYIYIIESNYLNHASQYNSNV